MFRAIAEGLPLFLAPFIAYAGWLMLRQRYPLLAEHWSRGVLSWLTLAGLIVLVAGVLLLGATRDHQRGAYQPAQMQDGHLVPGHFR